VIRTPTAAVPSIISQLGAKGARAASVISAGLESTDASGQSLHAAMLEAANPYWLRILGPTAAIYSPRALDSMQASRMRMRGQTLSSSYRSLVR
jgi:acetyltransferase